MRLSQHRDELVRRVGRLHVAAQAALVEAGTPVFHSLGAAARAMSRLLRWATARRP